MNRKRKANVVVRTTQPEDFQQIHRLCAKVYPSDEPWLIEELASHHRMFPQGQMVAIDPQTQQVVGMAASLIIDWNDYDIEDNWPALTSEGNFKNHNPQGRTLYGAEIMVDPEQQGRGIGKALYKARRELARSLQLLRIRAGARLRGYHKFKQQLTAREYVISVIHRQLTDPTLTFQLKQGFRVIAVVEDYLPNDPQSNGAAAVIEWINHQVAQRRDYRKRDPRYARSKHSQK